MLPIWTPQQDAELTNLWENEPIFAKEIGRQLGFSKNAVIGRAHRLKLAPKRKSNITPEIRAARSAAGRIAREYQIAQRLGKQWQPREKHRAPAHQPKLKLAPLPSLNVPLLELRPDQCRYATTENSPHLFCGQPSGKDTSYCLHHHLICHAPPHGREMKEIRQFRVDYSWGRKAA